LRGCWVESRHTDVTLSFSFPTLSSAFLDLSIKIKRTLTRKPSHIRTHFAMYRYWRRFTAFWAYFLAIFNSIQQLSNNSYWLYNKIYIIAIFCSIKCNYSFDKDVLFFFSFILGKKTVMWSIVKLYGWIFIIIRGTQVWHWNIQSSYAFLVFFFHFSLWPFSSFFVTDFP